MEVSTSQPSPTIYPRKTHIYFAAGREIAAAEVTLVCFLADCVFTDVREASGQSHLPSKKNKKDRGHL